MLRFQLLLVNFAVKIEGEVSKGMKLIPELKILIESFFYQTGNLLRLAVPGIPIKGLFLPTFIILYLLTGRKRVVICREYLSWQSDSRDKFVLTVLTLEVGGG